jgi:hypothetical protein
MSYVRGGGGGGGGGRPVDRPTGYPELLEAASNDRWLH